MGNDMVSHLDLPDDTNRHCRINPSVDICLAAKTMTNKKQPKPFEVIPAVRKEADGLWYAALSMYIKGELQQQSLLTEAGGFKNMRRAKQFARGAAGIMESRIKRNVLNRMVEMGEGLLKHG